MNHLFVYSDELDWFAARACINPARIQSVLERHDLSEGLELSLACQGRGIGRGRVLQADRKQIIIELLTANDSTWFIPRREPTSLVAAVPRPQTVRKLVQLAASSGLERLLFVKTARVVHGYLSSKALSAPLLEAEILKGLEQGGDVAAPVVEVCESLEQALDKLPAPGAFLGIFGDTLNRDKSPESLLQLRHKEMPIMLCIGPESGWTEMERSLLTMRGLIAYSLGPRVQRVENAAAMMLGACLVLRRQAETVRDSTS